MEVLWGILLVLIILLLYIKKWLIKINNDVVNAINLNTTQRENIRDTNIKLLAKTSIEFEKILIEQLSVINQYIENKKEPEIKEFEKQYYFIQKMTFLLPYETINSKILLDSLNYRMWDEKDDLKIIQQRFFIWFTKMIFEKKLNISDFNIIKKDRFDKYGMNKGFIILFKYMKQGEYDSILKTRLKDKSSLELNERWNDLDYEHENDYYLKSIRGIFEKDYNLVEKINNEIEGLYSGLSKILNPDEKVIIISFHEYLEFLSEAWGVYLNLFVQTYFLNEKNIDFINFLRIGNFDWTPNKKNEDTIDIYNLSNILDISKEEDEIIFKYKSFLLQLLSEQDSNNIKIIIDELIKLSESGYAYASLALGMIYLDGYKILKNPNKSKIYIEKTYEQGLTKPSEEIWNKFELWKIK